MSDSALNPSQQVEKIREILVGRQIHHVEDRLRQIEVAVQTHTRHVDEALIERVRKAQSTVLQETHNLRTQLQSESRERSAQISQLTRQLQAATEELQAASSDLQRQDREVELHLSEHLENISSEMAARIDARVREILQHLQAEIVQWKHQLDRDIQLIRDAKADRHEVRGRFARLASAAMEDHPNETGAGEEQGFLL